MIGDYKNKTRLTTEHEDILPNSSHYAVWANMEYAKTSLESSFNYWVLNPTPGNMDNKEFQIYSSR